MVSVGVVRVMSVRERVRAPLGWLAGGVRATSAYGALGFVGAEGRQVGLCASLSIWSRACFSSSDRAPIESSN